VYMPGTMVGIYTTLRYVHYLHTLGTPYYTPLSSSLLAGCTLRSDRALGSGRRKPVGGRGSEG